MGIIWGDRMKSKDELVIKATKEIVVKFIEMGRLSVNSFSEVWDKVYKTVNSSVGEDIPDKD